MSAFVGVIAGALIVAAGAFGGWYFLVRDADEAPPAPAIAAPPAAEPAAPASTTGSSPNPEPATTAAPAGVVCWDGSSAANIEACAPVTGATGLQWVFPSLAATWNQCDPTTLGVKGETRVAAYRCGVEAAGTAAVLIYSEYQSAEAVVNSYADRYQGFAASPEDDRSRYGPARVAPSGDQAFYATYVYTASDRWAVTAAAPDPQTAAAALAMVEMRPHDEVASQH